MVATVDYSIEEIKDEARHLVEQGTIDRQQLIYTLCEFIPPREWICVECELERNNYLLRDRICDLLPKEEWEED
ncbi:MAG: DUF4327 family protein [Xenococcaceae cyanobacterium MO_188.B32]|nr:DUF4327 family protein [Xenococcaceae cyanobacterium MO_188.B32]